MSQDISLRILLSAVGGGAVTSVINDIARSLGSGGLGGALLGIGAVAGGAAIALGVDAVQAAGDFQAEMTRLVTSAGELPQNLQMISDGILNLATATGTSTAQLASGMYYVESAGYHGADALKVLTTAAEGAKSENADLATVSNALTTVMADFGMGANQSTDAMNFLIAVVANGKTNLQDLAGAMYAVLPAASATGVHLVDVGAAMATMTHEGVPAADAATYLRQMIISLAAPSKASAKSLADIGLTTQEVSDEMKKSLPDTLKMIMDHLAATYTVGSPQYVQALKNIAGGSKQMQGMLDLTGDHLQTFMDDMGKVTDTMDANKGTVSGWALVQQNFNTKMDQAGQAIDTLKIKIGENLLPIVGQLVDFFTKNLNPTLDNIRHLFDDLKQHFLDAFNDKNGEKVKNLKQLASDLKDKLKDLGDWVKDHVKPALDDMATAAGKITDWISHSKQHFDDVKHWWKDWGGLIKAAADAITLYFVPAMIKAAVTSVTQSLIIAYNWIATIVKAGLTAITSAGQIWYDSFSFAGAMISAAASAVKQAAIVTASWVATTVTSGVQAVIAAAKIVGSFVASMITAGVQAAKQAAIVTASWVATMIASGWQAVVAALKITASFIASMIAAGVQAVKQAAIITASFIASMVKAGDQAETSAGKVGSFTTAEEGAGSAATTATGSGGGGGGIGILGLFAALVALGEGMKWTADQAANFVKSLDWNTWLDHVTQPIKDLVGWITQLYNLIVNPPGGGSAPPNVGKGGYGKGFGGGRASGGSVLAGHLYMVGEEGPEPFIPSTNGTIISNQQYRQGGLGGGGGGGTAINVTVPMLFPPNSAQVRQIVDMIEQELGRRVRNQTPGYNSAYTF